MDEPTEDHCPNPARNGDHEMYVEHDQTVHCRACGWVDEETTELLKFEQTLHDLQRLNEEGSAGE